MSINNRQDFFLRKSTCQKEDDIECCWLERSNFQKWFLFIIIHVHMDTYVIECESEWEEKKLYVGRKKNFSLLEMMARKRRARRNEKKKIYVLVGGTFSEGRKSFSSTLMVRDTDWEHGKNKRREEKKFWDAFRFM